MGRHRPQSELGGRSLLYSRRNQPVKVCDSLTGEQLPPGRVIRPGSALGPPDHDQVVVSSWPGSGARPTAAFAATSPLCCERLLGGGAAEGAGA